MIINKNTIALTIAQMTMIKDLSVIFIIKKIRFPSKILQLINQDDKIIIVNLNQINIP